MDKRVRANGKYTENGPRRKSANHQKKRKIERKLIRLNMFSYSHLIFSRRQHKEYYRIEEYNMTKIYEILLFQDQYSMMRKRRRRKKDNFGF